MSILPPPGEEVTGHHLAGLGRQYMFTLALGRCGHQVSAFRAAKPGMSVLRISWGWLPHRVLP